MFQFPTGWNSTCENNSSFRPSRLFQFPTGWNSTAAAMQAYDDGDSFNSQRDGILRAWRAALIELKPSFQFPTGWNSTKKDRKMIGQEYRFNSQRDGILQICRAIRRQRTRFQFPTGWNSTSAEISLPAPQDPVSIPNGMEFYPLHQNKCIWHIRVSIPNGMEFYSRKFL